MVRLMALIVLLGVCACGPTTGDVKAQVVAPLDLTMTQFGLQIVSLPNVEDIHSLRGQNFIFVAGANIPWSVYSDAFDEGTSFTSAQASFFSKISLQPVRLNLTWNGSYFNAADFDSLYMLTAYHLFENAKQFFLDVIGDRSKATSSPIYVSVYGAYTSRGIIRVPLGFMDNSAYLPLEDMFKMYRVADQEGLPFQMNPGVVVHEYQHRVFHEHVFLSKGDKAFRNWKIFNSADASLKYARIRTLLRATDEGLADINAVGYSRNPNFLAVSKTALDLKFPNDQRNLDGAFAQAATYDNLADSSIESRFLSMCNGESANYGNTHWRYYCLGTVIANTLWESADKDTEILRNEVLPAVNASLDDLGNELLSNFEKYDIDVLWRLIVTRLNSQRAEKLCDHLRLRFSSLYPKVTQCVR